MRPRSRLALLLLPVLLVSGCSTDEGAPSAAEPPARSAAPTSAAPDATPAPEPSEPPESSAPPEISEPPEVVFPNATPPDPTTEQGVITLADLGGDWVELQPAGGSAPTAGGGSRIGCAFQPEAGADPATVTSVADGPIFQKGPATAYATSTVVAFLDEAAAAAAVEGFRSPGWSACRVTTKDAEIPAPEPGAEEQETSWRADPLLEEGRGQGGYEGTARFQYQAVVDGQQVDANGTEVVSFYRVGSRVLLVTIELVSTEADTPEFFQAFEDEVYAATLAVLGKIGG